MKIVEKIVSADKKKITEVVSIGNKKYKRISCGVGEKVEWRRFKTNHEVNKSEYSNLEKSWMNRFKNPSPKNNPDPHFGKDNMYASGYTSIHSFVAVENFESEEFDRADLERGLREASNNGANKLAGVKFIKDETGWGLRESKDFADEVFEKMKISQSW